MSLRAIQKRDRNKLSSAQQKQHHIINKSRSFGGGPTVSVVIGSGSTSSNISSVGAGATGGHSHHRHQHHQLSSKNEKWRNSSTVSISSSAAPATTAALTHKKRSVSYPSLQKRNSATHSSSSLRFTKSESDLHSSAQSPGGIASSDAVDTNNLYLGAKSEVCLRTLAVKSTHQPPAPFRQGSLTSATTGGSGGGGHRHRMYESSRRPSEFSGGDLGRADKYAEISSNNNVAVRIPIIGYEVMEERARFTIFKLRIENSISHTCWLVLRRYTDFVRLNNKLRTLFPHCPLILPRKKWFGDNFSSGFIDNRIQGLQAFINTLMGDDAMRTCPVVREFFCLDEPPSYSESMEESRIIFEAQEETISHLKQQLQTKDELISALQAKLANEMSRNKVLGNVLRSSLEDCPKCAKQIGNHLKESTIK